MKTSAPSWSAIASWGAGLLLIAVGAGRLADESSGFDAWGIGVVLIALGIAGLVWGATALARGRIVVPRASVASALGGIGALVAALVVSPGRTSVIAVAAASALLMAVALAGGWHLRHSPQQSGRAAPQHSARHSVQEGTRAGSARLLPLFLSAVVVAGVVTPALGATEAGRLAPDHSEHTLIDPGHSH